MIKSSYLGRRRDSRAQRIFRAVKTTLYDTVMVDTFHDTFVQTHRMYNSKSEP